MIETRSELTFKNRLISLKIQDSCTPKRVVQSKRSIGKIVNFLIKFSFLFALCVSPFSANAGILSAISGFFNSSASASAPSSDNTSSDSGQDVKPLEAATNDNPTGSDLPQDLSVVDGKALLSQGGVSGTIADVVDKPTNDQISVYVVHKGDTLASIAKMYNVSQNTIKWANDTKNGIKEGDVLAILPVSGIKYVVKKGDTIASVAKKYKADADEIQQFNDVAVDGILNVGDQIIIPDGEISTPVAPTQPKKYTNGNSRLIPGSSGPNYSGYYTRPLVGGRKTQGLHGHNAVDFGTPVGTPILAAADGTVILAKMGVWNGGYGNYIVVSHPNGTQTLYAHLSVISVERGQQVEQGQRIGLSGNTGESTGPHLHFEVRGAVNPF